MTHSNDVLLVETMFFLGRNMIIGYNNIENSIHTHVPICTIALEEKNIYCIVQVLQPDINMDSVTQSPTCRHVPITSTNKI